MACGKVDMTVTIKQELLSMCNGEINIATYEKWLKIGLF
jgi:hypothetical protein